MARLVVDIETSSACDLADSGSWAYAEHPTTEILIIAYANADTQEQPKIWSKADLSADLLLPCVLGELLCAEKLIAHNANFERECLSQLNPAFRDPRRWIDTSVMCGVVGRPRSLKDACKSLCLPTDKQKDARGVRLIGLFSIKTRKAHKTPEQAPREFAEFCSYCGQDVIAERHIYQLLRYSMDDYFEPQLALDFAVTDNGAPIDQREALGAARLYDRLQDEAESRCLQITGGAAMRSTKALREWTASKGWPLESFAAGAVDQALADAGKCAAHPEVAEFLQLRKAASGTAGKKYAAILAMLARDQKCHGILVGRAAHTGRYAGRGLQPQNLPRGNFDKDFLPLIRSIAQRAASPDQADAAAADLDLIAGDRACDALAAILRDCIAPIRSDECLVVSDYSAIEARVLAWLAGETWVEDIFAGDGKIYERTAAAMYCKGIDSITKAERMAGKIATLALGYGGGIGALARMAEAYGVQFTDEQAQGIVDSWRQSRPKTVKLWGLLNDMILQATENGIAVVHLAHTQINARMIRIADRPVLAVELPSKRYIYYWNPKIIRLENNRKEIIVEMYGATGDNYAGIQPEAEGAHNSKLYGGKLTENIIQAIAFDILLNSLLKLYKRGLNICFHVHDEIVISCKKDISNRIAETMVADMTQLPEWAHGLVLATEPEIMDRYKK